MHRVLLIASGGGHTGHAYTVYQFIAGRIKADFIVPENDSFTIKKLKGLGILYPVLKPLEPKTPLPRSIPGFIRAFIESRRIPFHEYSVVVCFGSNHCIAPFITARLHGVLGAVVEDVMRIVTPSRAVKLLSRISNYIFLSWPEQKRIYPRGIYVGPLYENRVYEPKNKGYILVVTGTYGYPELVDTMLKTGLDNLVIQTGRDDPEKYRAKRPDLIIFDFDPDIARWIAGADVVICHQGRTAVDAALTYGKPVIIVNNPRWIRAQTVLDTYLLAEKIGARFYLWPNKEKLLRDIRSVKQWFKPRVYPNGAKYIAEILSSIGF